MQDSRGTPATDRLLYLVNRVARALNRAAEDVAAGLGVALPEFMTLLVLGEGEPLSNATLARRTFVTSQAAHQVVTALVDRGLVERTVDPGDRRKIAYSLTDRGWDLLSRGRATLDELEARVLAGMDASRRDVLGPALLDAAMTLRGGWFGDEAAEAASAARRATGQRRRLPST